MKNNYKCCNIAVLIPLLYIILQLETGKVYSQNIQNQQTVSGIISNQNELPVPGVNVLIKGTATGTITNLDGYYSIRASVGDTLVYSYVGYQTIEKEFTRGYMGDIIMQPAADALSEVIVNAGYYNTTGRERTGNISRVTAAEIENQPLVNPLQALQGRMAGVEISPASSHPGGAVRIRIRGINSLREEGNLPLYIIDGMPVNSTPIESNSLIGNRGIDPLNNLNISNIESIEILKDADATAIYGSRGANGVVLITTKSAKRSNGTGLEINMYAGVATMPNRLDLLNTQEYLQVRNAALENDGQGITERNAYDLLVWDQDRYTDWQDFLFGGSSETLNTNLNFSGGDDLTSYRIGGSFFDQGTIYPTDYEYQKITGNVNLNHHSKDNRFSIAAALNYGVDDNTLAGNIDLNASIFALPPNAPEAFNSDGSLNWEDWNLAGLDNPLEGYYNSNVTTSNNLISNINFTYELFKGLQLKANLGYTHYSSEELWKLPARSNNPQDSYISSSYHLSNGRESWIAEPQLIYDNKFSKLNLQFILGSTFQENTSDQTSFQGYGYASDNLIGNIAAAETILNARNVNSMYRYSAVFSRIGINWNRKYYLNLTGRRDGSSRFGSNNKFANFGAIGVAWIFSEEEFLKKLNFLSFGKLRSSYGSTGNDQIGDYGYLDAYEPTVGPGGLIPVGLANPDYSWEVNKKFEAGLELGFFQNCLETEISFYQNRSSNQLVGYPLPYITGFNSVQANLPATVENKGWEFVLHTRNIENSNLAWNTSLNFTIPKNKLVAYPDIEESSYANTYRIGEPLNISLLYEYTGVDAETGRYSIRDVNEDGRYDYQDQIIVFNANREFYGGINNSIEYKNFSLQFLFEFVKQKGTLNLFNAGPITNVLDDVLVNNRYQQFSQSVASQTAYRNMSESNFTITDASFVRLKTLSLNYSFPEEITKSLRFKELQLYIHAQNLFTLTPYEGLDPDRPNTGTSFTNLRSITGGLRINI
ncbi:SusC/RagA family TonB-linked outer membrane protein [Zunongwangia profunda]|uniref:SusC/RagA family TonB-linked outer membrane protein n=3 Tax=Zunongwangia profunda TaxID=398743 RepID=UPI000C62EDC0|nr:SusC/RagA family TonB-linked outer membrane protein [Zunongwangia profunda]MAS72449.1 SusC/RagA family protein [Zunongwangia sp.]|tara:strand:+ start:12361 stop:15330 length:2970 start_codon:yes stop_codon:yes gene_type:complete